MELLRPLDTAADPAGSVTVLVRRTVPVAQEEAFRAALHDLLEEFHRAPGVLGSLVFRQEDERGVEFTILQRFAGPAEHDAWLASPAFPRWRRAVAPPEPAPDHVRHYSGVESLFVTARAPDAPPMWKMAVLMLLAAYPLSLVAAYWLGPRLGNLPPYVGAFVTSVVMVVAMTYVLVPVLTRVFERWLQPPGKESRGLG